MKIIIVLIVLIVCTFQSSPRCLNHEGKVVDWFAIYATTQELRRDIGVGYLYFDSESTEWKAYPYTVDHVLQEDLREDAPEYYDKYHDTKDPSAFLNTVSQISDKKLPFIAWNGQQDAKTQDQVNSDSGDAHAKFFMTVDESGLGFAMSHSAPKYPKITDDKNLDPVVGSGQKKLAQDYFCFNIDSNIARQIYDRACIMEPKIYYNNLFFGQNCDARQKQEEGKNILTYDFKVKNYNLKAFFKEDVQRSSHLQSGREPIDIFIEGIAPGLRSSIINGNYRYSKTPSTCQGKIHTINNQQSYIFFKKQGSWRRGNDHSKWCVTEHPSIHWSCFGDLNRDSPAQLRRGGGFYCIEHKGLKCAMRSLMNKVEQCEDANEQQKTLESCKISGGNQLINDDLIDKQDEL